MHTLTSEQLHALDEMRRFLLEGEEATFTLSGPAECGKATALAAVTREFSRATSCAITGKAALTLRQKNCLTTHKAHGSEFSSVVLADEFPINDPDRARWVYTPLAKASDSIIVARGR